MSESIYGSLAKRLDSLPEGFPGTPSHVELRILEYLFDPEEAKIATNLKLHLESARQIHSRLGGDFSELKNMLKDMARKGLIRMGKAEAGGLGFGLLPFVVGIYEMQGENLDITLAELFEEYYQQAFASVTTIEPKFHRVIPVGESIRNDISIEPFENAATIIENAQAWGVTQCICRLQKSLIGNPCDHPIDVCMTFSQRPGVFDGSPVVKALTKEEAYNTLKIAADAGLVHSVSNNMQGDSNISHYICNCCTCSCGILRGIADFKMSNVIARSGFVTTVNPELCVGCEICVDYCQFHALSLRPEDVYVQIDRDNCVGCGVCVTKCPEGALVLVRRPEDEIINPPQSHKDWLIQRAMERGLDISEEF